MAIRRAQGYGQFMSDTQEWFFLGDLPHADLIEGLAPGYFEFDTDKMAGKFVPTGNPKVKEGTIVTSFEGFDKEARAEMHKRGELGRVEGLKEDRGADLPSREGVSMSGLDADAFAALRAETDAKIGALGSKLDLLLETMTRKAGAAAKPASLGDSDGGVSGEGMESEMGDGMSGALGVVGLGQPQTGGGSKRVRAPQAASEG